MPNSALASEDLNSDSAVQANIDAEERITENTKYVEEIWHISEATYREVNEQLPEEYDGNTKDELISNLSSYMKNMSQEEKKAGLVSIVVSSFSPNKVEIRKVYDDKSDYEYYVTIKNGMVVVLENDKKTIVEDTGIHVDELDEESKQELKDGVYYNTLDEVYNLLESFCS